MRQFAGRLVRSQYGPARPAPRRNIRHLPVRKPNLSVTSRGNAVSVASTGLQKVKKDGFAIQIRCNHDNRGPRGAYWFHPDNWLKKERTDVIYGDDRDLDNLPPEPPKKEWWMDAQYPAGKLQKPTKKAKAQPPSLKTTHFLKAKTMPELKARRSAKARPAKSQLMKTLAVKTKDYAHFLGKESKDFQDFKRESEVECQETLGKLLVDVPGVNGYHDYWFQLLKFRARIDGNKGIQAIWTGMSMRNIEIPVSGPMADEIWRYFLKAGCEDEEFLKKIYHYNLYQFKNAKGEFWKPFYDELVGGTLQKNPSQALLWHSKLIDMYPRSKLEHFFQANAGEPQNLWTLFRIFASPKVGPSYDMVIPFLCQQEQYEIAINWHKMFFNKKDLPADSHVADRLLEYYAFHKPLKELEELLRDFHAKGIKFVQGTPIALIKARYRTPAMMELFCKLYTEKVLPNDCFTDKFWAFLLTYQRFTEADVTRYMKRLDIDHIGESTTKEFVKRSRTIAAFVRGISLLHKRKMEVDEEVYNKFLEVKARYQPQEALEESLPIEGLQISRANALLHGYLSTYRWKFFNHVYIGIRMKNCATWNLFLRRLFMTGQTKAGLELMEEMRAIGLPIQSAGQRELLRAILLPRRPGHRPITQSAGAIQNKDLRLATNYLRALLMNGENVEPGLWLEVIKRFGMFGKLRDLERLCLWLADWYNPQKHISHQPSIPIKFTDVGGISSLEYKGPEEVAWTEPPITKSENSPKNPLRILFPLNTLRALIEWGFMSMHRTWYLDLIRRDSSIAEKAQYSRCVWGVRLVRKLKEKGVWVDKRSVARAVRVRLRALEGSRYHWESFDTNMSKHEPINLGTIAAIAEKAWGEELFPQGSWSTEQGLLAMLKAPPVKNLVLRRPRIRTTRRSSSILETQHTLVPTVSQI
ncbi:hypothetical protein H072_11505 [Dactylellina haptotyla CBS 200.50]|uniref:Pentatricopeptide repeat domain-containing protein n=1 Tax=Dactylellina haptotyla (strain CBS 200.50) TaxID=1284197 RepID=S8A1Z8_DACHA|nr:hypothetical protein H072_11505 [Dactylellina haptotyla CBS 200.50]